MASPEPRRAIGGEFETPALALGAADRLARLTHGVPGTWTASARSALGLILAHLRERGIERLHLPSYVCESVLLPARALGLAVSFYPVDRHLVAHPDPAPNSAVLVIHYFGWLNPAAERLRAAAPSVCLIEDASQALLSGWSAPAPPSHHLLLSPRKFGPVPAVGWCSLPAETAPPTAALESLAWRSVAARLARGAYLARPDAPIEPAVEEFYQSAFHAMEGYLNEHPLEAGVPPVALDMVAGWDVDAIAERRRANWRTLRELVSPCVEMLQPELPDDVVPLGMAVRLRNRNAVRRHMAAQRIFCPVHWPLPAAIPGERFPDAVALARECLTLPIDQRYDGDYMQRIADTLKAAL